jgi:hypothetical protein
MDLQLPVQSVPITTKVASSNSALMQSSCVNIGQQNTIYRLKPLDVEMLIEEIGIVIYVIIRNSAMSTIML